MTFSYWDNQEGYPDIPESYTLISYVLDKETMGIRLTYSHEKILQEFERVIRRNIYPGIFANIKKLAENVDIEMSKFFFIVVTFNSQGVS